MRPSHALKSPASQPCNARLFHASGQLIEGIGVSMPGPQAEKALLETAHNLSIGISNLIVGLSPQMIVIGGPLTRAWPLVSEVFRETVERSVRRGLPLARIVASTLGESTTLMGSLSLVFASKFTYEPAA